MRYTHNLYSSLKALWRDVASLFDTMEAEEGKSQENLPKAKRCRKWKWYSICKASQTQQTPAVATIFSDKYSYF